MQGELCLAAYWVPVCRQVLRQSHLKETQSPGLASERGATADSSPEPSSKTWGCVQHRSSVPPMRLWIKLLLFLQTSFLITKYLIATFLCFSYPLRLKVTKTLSPVWDYASHPDQAWGFFSPHEETIVLPQQHQIIPSEKTSAGAVNVLFRSLSFQKVILNKSQCHSKVSAQACHSFT